MSFEENFLYPFYLILVGGLVSGVLIPSYNELVKRRQNELEEVRRQKNSELEEIKRQKQVDIDRKREDHRNELEVKTSIVQKIAKLYAIASYQIYELSKHTPNSLKESPISEKDNMEWFLEREVISALINAHFRNSEIIRNWFGYSHNLDLMRAMFEGLAIGTKLSPMDLEVVKEYFKNEVTFDWDELSKGENVIDSYNELIQILSNRNFEIINQILDENTNTQNNTNES